MRIEALAGDHFVFQQELIIGDYEVVVLHRDAFDVAMWPEHGFIKPGYEEGFAGRFDNRFREDDDDDDDE